MVNHVNAHCEKLPNIYRKKSEKSKKFVDPTSFIECTVQEIPHGVDSASRLE